jgi:hypothetical protein
MSVYFEYVVVDDTCYADLSWGLVVVQALYGVGIFFYCEFLVILRVGWLFGEGTDLFLVFCVFL